MTEMIIILGAVVLIVLSGILIYNRLISRKNHVLDSWSGIDVQLKRRHNLIPNLVNTVQGYVKHEKGLMRELTQLRSGILRDDSVSSRSSAESKLSGSIRNLLAVAESYPELKANQNFENLQNNLDQVENEIQHARRYYNGTVRVYNTLCQSFPSNLIANWFRFRDAEFFEIELASDRALPEVRF